ncbi:glycosyltransferase family 4 protein [Adlercreutzia sp. ZJ242]|uniref:glycosyltransferase family 4 protein n=1 Tax=Adlercreutzia sp. ZJ242 TaxID=2709409 RepID=UPI0013EBD352|nr:glycosyltransferase family 4 protein [Adlercreutzia sp. ZJ242]
MKILILANSDMGLYRFRQELIEALVAEGHEVVCSLPEGGMVAKIVDLGARFVPCCSLQRHGTNPLAELRLISFYESLLKDERPDIVFTYTIKPNVYGGMACGRLGIPYVVNITGLGTAVENGGALQAITLFLYKRGLAKAQKVFFQNEDNRDFMLGKGAVSGACDLLPGSGVNVDRFPALEYPDDGRVRFLFIARIMKEKGIEQYLDAAEQIKKRHPDAEFHVCGACEPEYKGRLRQCQESGAIVYHGCVEDVLPLYEMASCVVLPSYYPEGMSNVLLESCACARPIITTDRPGCREIVDDWVNGFIVRERDSECLIQKMEAFLALPRDQRVEMGKAGRKKVRREFDRQIVVLEYLKELEQHEKTGK